MRVNHENFGKLKRIIDLISNIPFDILDHQCSRKMCYFVLMILKMFEMSEIDHSTKQDCMQSLINIHFYICRLYGDKFLAKIDSYSQLIEKSSFSVDVEKFIIMATPNLLTSVVSHFFQKSYIRYDGDSQEILNLGKTMMEVVESLKDVSELQMASKDIVWQKLKPLYCDKKFVETNLTFLLNVLAQLLMLDRNIVEAQAKTNLLKLLKKVKSGSIIDRLEFVCKHFEVFDKSEAKQCVISLAGRVDTLNFSDLDAFERCFPPILDSFTDEEVANTLNDKEDRSIQQNVNIIRLFLIGVVKSTRSTISKELKSKIVKLLPDCQHQIFTDDVNLVDTILNFQIQLLEKCQFLHIKHHMLVSVCLSLLAFSNIDQLLETATIFDRVMKVLNVIFKLHPSTVANNVPIFMCLIKKMQQTLVKMSFESNLTDNQRRIVEFSRMINLMVQKCPTDFEKVISYIVADFMALLKNYPLQNRARNMFLAYINRLLDLCDEHSVALIATNVDDATKHIFNFIYEDYVKYYKYKGFV